MDSNIDFIKVAINYSELILCFPNICIDFGPVRHLGFVIDPQINLKYREIWRSDIKRFGSGSA